MLTLDHLAISALTLEDGTEWAEAALGVVLQNGGQHLHMATHNRLLGLGDIYLEVIAPDPSRPKPQYPRWFDLDRFTGPPRLTSWIARCDDLATERAASPPVSAAIQGNGSAMTQSPAAQIAGSHQFQDLFREENTHRDINIAVAMAGRQCCSNG